MSKKLTFEKLEIGDKFIAFPVAGDDNGHGGFKGAHILYRKCNSPLKMNGESVSLNAIRASDGEYTSIPNSMKVIKIA